MNDNNLYQLCYNEKWRNAQKYLSSDATDEEKKRNVFYTDNYDRTALHYACMPRGSRLKGASYNIINMMVDVGGKDLVMAKDHLDETALHWVCHFINHHYEAADKIKLFLEVGDANVLSTTMNYNGHTPLEIATIRGTSNKITSLLTPQSNSVSINNNNSSSNVVPADNGSDDASPTQQSNHTSQTSSANNNLNGTVHKLQAQLKEALHLAGALTLKTKEVFQSERMNADLQKKNENLGKKITDLEQSVDSKEADIACMSKQKERDDKDIAYWKEQVAKKTQICSEQKAKIQEMASKKEETKQKAAVS